MRPVDPPWEVLQLVSTKRTAECPVCLAEVPRAAARKFPCHHAVCSECFDLMTQFEFVKLGSNPLVTSLTVRCPVCRSASLTVEYANKGRLLAAAAAVGSLLAAAACCSSSSYTVHVLDAESGEAEVLEI